MKTVLFTKMFKGHGLDAIAEHTSRLGFDGTDLLIRNGFQVSPDQPDRIGPAIARLAAAGLSVPMATTDLNNADGPGTERLFAAIRDAGITVVRLGYWPYRPESGYRALFEQARRDLDGLEGLARRTDLTLAIQLHGDTLHGSGAQTLALLEGHDPRYIGAYPDPGNQTVQDGREDWRLTFDVLAPWLTCVGVKNGGWFPHELAESGQRRWHSDWLGLADGMVPWDDIIAHLRAIGFDGLLTLHSHYEVPFDSAIAQTHADLVYVRRLLGAAVHEPSQV